MANVAGTAKPYVDRALHDEELRDHMKQAYAAARVIYDELIAPRGVVGAAQKVATDQDIQENLRVAIAELREAAMRLQGGQQKSHGGRNFLLLVGLHRRPALQPVHRAGDAGLAEGQAVRRGRRVRLRRPSGNGAGARRR